MYLVVLFFSVIILFVCHNIVLCLVMLYCNVIFVCNNVVSRIVMCFYIKMIFPVMSYRSFVGHNICLCLVMWKWVIFLFLSDHNDSYRFHSPNMSESTKDPGVNFLLYFKEIAAQAYLLQFKGSFILYFNTNIQKGILYFINSS